MQIINGISQDFHPFVRYAGKVTLRAGTVSAPRAAYDHRLFFALSDSVVFRGGASDSRLKYGDALLVLSATPYQIYAEASDGLIYAVNFDFFPPRDPVLPPLPLPMSEQASYRPELRLETLSFSDPELSGGAALVPGMFDLLPQLDAMSREAERAEWLYLDQLRAHMLLCLNALFRRIAVPQRSWNAHQDILGYCSAHFTENLSNSAIAAHFHYHPNYISEVIRSQTGQSLHQYLLRLRVRRATELLLSENCSVAEIAAKCGFSDPDYFTQYFRRMIGCTPSEFRR